MRFLRPPAQKEMDNTGSALIRLIISLVCSGFNGIIGVFHLFSFRDAIMRMVEQSSLTFWSWNFIEAVVVIVSSIVWLAMVYLTQHFYAKKFIFNWIPKGFLGFTAFQLVFFGATYLYLHL